MPAVRGVAIVLGVTALPAAGVAVAATGPTVQTDRGCYVVGQSVHFSGSGFAPQRSYDVAIDGVDFGQSQTDASGALSDHLVPGGLPAGSPQSVDQLDVSDGSSDAVATFTVTRAAGARFLASRGDPRSLRAAFQVWGFSPTGAAPQVYLHYVSPSGQPRDTVSLGRTGGQCGYLLTPRMRFFPFAPSTGRWTLQADTQQRYSSHPSGAVARIYVQIARG
jgi:hypothetical protein